MTEHIHSRSVAAIVAAGSQDYPSLALCAASPRIRLQAGRSPAGYKIGAYIITTCTYELSELGCDSAILTVDVNWKAYTPPEARALRCLDAHIGWWLQRVGGPISLRLTDCSTSICLGVKPVTAFPSLVRELYLSDCFVQESSWLSACTQLVELDISYHCRLKGIDWIAASRSTLTNLKISGVSKEAQLRVLGTLQQLRILSIERIGFTHAGSIKWIEELSLLEELSIHDCESIVDLGAIGRLHHLKVLNLFSLSHGSERIRWLGDCKSLEKLAISHCSQSIIDFSEIGCLCNLRALDLASLSIGCIEWIANCDSLETLVIFYCQRISNFSAIGSLQSLKVLTIILTDVDSIDGVGGCSSLETLIIRGDIRAGDDFYYSHPFDDDYNYDDDDERLPRRCCRGITDYSALGRLQQLNKLHISRADVKDVDWIGNCGFLQTLHISNCHGITDFSAIGCLQNLKDLTLSAAILKIIDWIEGCTSLETVDISDCKFITDFSVFDRLPGVRVSRYPSKSWRSYRVRMVPDGLTDSS